jgi:hypothetical protein
MEPAHLELLWDRRPSSAHFKHAVEQLEGLPEAAQELLLESFSEASTAHQVFTSTPGGMFGRVADSWNDAYRAMGEAAAALAPIRHFTAALDEDELARRAELAVASCARRTRLAEKIAYVEGFGIELPAGPLTTRTGLLARFADAGWWHRRFRRLWGIKLEDAMREAGYVNGRAAVYLSDFSARRYQQQQVKQHAAVDQLDLLDTDCGEVLPLRTVADNSLANPQNRNAEMMTHARGLQEYARHMGMVAMMVTLTCPSRFHAVNSGSYTKNPKFDGSTVREGQAWLCATWARIRAEFKRRGWEIPGWRVAEPHHDGTPHWHLLLYMSERQRNGVQYVLEQYAFRESYDEPGADRHRLNMTLEDPSRGSCVGYLATYIAKNLSGASHRAYDTESGDLGPMTMTDAAARAVAWARVHGIRQFQSFGQPVKALWRHARRVAEPEAPEQLDLALAAVVDQTRQSERGGKPNWAGLIALLGGHKGAWRRSRCLLDYDRPATVDSAGRLVLRMGRWGEYPPYQPMGLKVNVGVRVIRYRTRTRAWRLIHRLSGSPAPLGPVAITVRATAPSAVEPKRKVNEIIDALAQRMSAERYKSGVDILFDKLTAACLRSRGPPEGAYDDSDPGDADPADADDYWDRDDEPAADARGPGNLCFSCLTVGTVCLSQGRSGRCSGVFRRSG